MLLALFMAMLFPQALPPIVNEAIKLVRTRVIQKMSTSSLLANNMAIVEAAAPDNIPQMSPITSLQKLDTFEAFFISLMASLEPFTFLAAIE